MDGPWKVYFELNGKTNDEALEFLQKNVDRRSLWYVHPHGKVKGPHIHGLIFNHQQTDETLRSKIKKYFNLDKPSMYGISNKYEKGTKMSEETIPTYISYMTKGQFDPLLNIGFDNEYVNERKREWKEKQSIHISGDLTIITHGEVKKKRITQVTIANAAIQEYNQMITTDNAHLLDNPDHDIMYKLVVKLLKANGMSTNYRQCSNIIQDMCSTLDSRRHRLKVLSMI